MVEIVRIVRGTRYSDLGLNTRHDDQGQGVVSEVSKVSKASKESKVSKVSKASRVSTRTQEQYPQSLCTLGAIRKGLRYTIRILCRYR